MAAATSPSHERGSRPHKVIPNQWLKGEGHPHTNREDGKKNRILKIRSKKAQLFG